MDDESDDAVVVDGECKEVNADVGEWMGLDAN
jgi:hypothetical protein